MTSTVSRIVMATLVAAMVVSARSVASADDNLGGTIKFTGTYNVTNPCNNEQLAITTLMESVSVAADADKGHEIAQVSVRWTAVDVVGGKGGVYDVRGQAHASFDWLTPPKTGNTASGYYIIPIVTDFDSDTNKVDSFTDREALLVYVDVHQKPTETVLLGGIQVCDGK